MTDVFGSFVTGADVESAVRSTLTLWMPAYTFEVARQKSTTLPPIRVYGQSLATLPTGEVADELPAVIVVAPGLNGDPVERGDGAVDATWAVGVGVVVSAQTSDMAQTLAKLYGAAIRGLLVQKGSLGGFATGTSWTDEETTPYGYDTVKAVAQCILMFEVQVPAVVNRFGGPAVPPPDPTVASTVGAVSVVHIGVQRST